MTVDLLKYTSIGQPSESQPCPSYFSIDAELRYTTLYWYNSQRQTIAACRSRMPSGGGREVIYDFTMYDPPLDPPESDAAPAEKPQPPAPPADDPAPSGGGGHPWSVRDIYDNPEDLWEENRDLYDDEDEAWDEWYDG